MSKIRQKSAGAYQCHPEDDINNLRIRIKIWKTTTENNEEEIYDFKWQEKVFNMQELTKYKEMPESEATEHGKRCKKILDRWVRVHHKMLKEHRLYSQIDEEISQTVTAEEPVTDFENEKLTATELNFREAQASYSDDPVIDDRPAGQLTQAKLVTSPTHEDTLRQFFRSPKPQQMRIMFDQSPKLTRQQRQQQQQEEQELDATLNEEQQQQQQEEDKTQKVLCSITYNPRDQQLTITPDFTKEPLILGNWRYSIENAAAKMSEAELSRLFSLANERARLKAESQSLFRPTDFEMPASAEALRLLVRGEIVAARHFEFDNVYVQFFIDLPNDWWASSAQGLSGVTQICSTRTENTLHPFEQQNDVAFFSFPIEFELHYQRTVPTTDSDYDFPRWPVMYFEVMSQDAWTRHRTEGYTHMTLPSRPGAHKFHLQCWRPSGDSVVCELRRYFVGGTPSLEDATFTKAPSDFSGTLLSKFGLSTESTGELEVRMHCMHQSAAAMQRNAGMTEHQAGHKRSGVAAGFKSAGPSQAELMRALTRFRAARTQLITVQKSSFLSQSQLYNGSSGGGWQPQHANGSAGGQRRHSRHDQDDDEEEEEDGENRLSTSSGLLDTRTQMAEQYSRQLREE